MVKDSKILVAGGSGFIGSNLISDLVSLGNEVISISKSMPNANRKIKYAKYILHDLEEPINKNEFKLLRNIDYLVNCSGYIDHKSFSQGGKAIFNNHFESVHLLSNLAIDLNVKSFIQIGSSDEYGKRKCPIEESSRESPISPYSLGKLTSTHFLQQCNNSGILKTVILRPFLILGKGKGKTDFCLF